MCKLLIRDFQCGLKLIFGMLTLYRFSLKSAFGQKSYSSITSKTVGNRSVHFHVEFSIDFLFLVPLAGNLYAIIVRFSSEKYLSSEHKSSFESMIL